MVAASNALSALVNLRLLGASLLAGLSLAACASAPAPAGPGATYGFVRAAQPGAATGYEQTASSAGVEERETRGGRYKLGSPYQVANVWYVPAEDPAYDVEGTASVYGDGLQGKPTANGELFDAQAFTGAHPTLPMPAIVEVTNLENGRSLRVRLNDRGAHKPGRVIDLSRGAAERLGFADKGAAKVRVRWVGPARLDRSTEPLYVQAPAEPVIRTDPNPQIAAAPAAGLRDGYVVQAGAFSDPSRAKQVASRLAVAGAAAVRPVEVAGRTLYRVVVGSWGSEAQADAARAQVASLGFADARVVRSF